MHTNESALGMVNMHTHAQKWKCILLICRCNPWLEMLPETSCLPQKGLERCIWDVEQTESNWSSGVGGESLSENGEWKEERAQTDPWEHQHLRDEEGERAEAEEVGEKRRNLKVIIAKGTRGFKETMANRVRSTEKWDSWGQESAQLVSRKSIVGEGKAKPELSVYATDYYLLTL